MKSSRTNQSKAGTPDSVTFPVSMWKLLRIIGSKMYAPGKGKSVLNSKYAQTICMVLSDNDEKKAADLLKLAEVAYKDYAKLNPDTVKFAP